MEQPEVEEAQALRPELPTSDLENSQERNRARAIRNLNIAEVRYNYSDPSREGIFFRAEVDDPEDAAILQQMHKDGKLTGDDGSCCSIRALANICCHKGTNESPNAKLKVARVAVYSTYGRVDFTVADKVEQPTSLPEAEAAGRVAMARKDVSGMERADKEIVDNFIDWDQVRSVQQQRVQLARSRAKPRKQAKEQPMRRTLLETLQDSTRGIGEFTGALTRSEDMADFGWQSSRDKAEPPAAAGGQFWKNWNELKSRIIGN